MSSINGLGNNSPVQQTQNIAARPAPAPAEATDHVSSRAVDRLELSGVSHMFKALKNNDVRAEKVASIKAQIESGTYDTDGKKLDAALDSLLDDLTR
jgi:anti-sigma28 factor (negative regulator of flagellin synthesis)